MKTKSKVLLGVAVGLLVVLGASFFASGASLQGRFIGGGSISLSSSSPSGARSVSSSDDFFAFDVTATSTRPTVIQAGDMLQVTFRTDANDINETVSSATSAERVTLSCDGASFGAGYIVPVDDRFAAVGVVMVNELTVAASDTSTCSFNTSTSNLLEEDSGVDDPLAVTMRYGNTLLTGNTINY